ncbi:hypothetical protein EDB19DRAFT_1706620 [Suillus lakei]|nr:hypothetical protein EDB19DRAFT_1706620 [Suillus lakei]
MSCVVSKTACLKKAAAMQLVMVTWAAPWRTVEEEIMVIVIGVNSPSSSFRAVLWEARTRMPVDRQKRDAAATAESWSSAS